MNTYYVTVTFTIDNTDAKEAERIVTEYLDEAARCVVDPVPYYFEFSAVDVDKVEQYIPEGDA
jgi:hypothetical protein